MVTRVKKLKGKPHRGAIILATIDKKERKPHRAILVLLLSPNIAGNLMNPGFIDLLIEHPNTVLIIED